MNYIKESLEEDLVLPQQKIEARKKFKEYLQTEVAILQLLDKKNEVEEGPGFFGSIKKFLSQLTLLTSLFIFVLFAAIVILVSVLFKYKRGGGE